ncbi:Protein XRI1, partial [Cucurbita argyrosperma subsp. argyrosperma]
MNTLTDLHSLPFFNSAVHHPSSPPPISTGYLEDAFLEFTSKRPRFDHHLLQLEFPHTYWSSCCTWEGDAFNSTNQIHHINHNYDYYYYDTVSPDEMFGASPKSRISDETNTDLSMGDMKTPEIEAFSTPNDFYYAHQADAEFLPCKQPISTDGGSVTKRPKKRKVVYPFELVKPGGIDGDITLNDINENMLMPPTRPVRHPVGDFACRPCVSAEGPGLSGKAVVALTKIHTRGRRGSITIIRTRG